MIKYQLRCSSGHEFEGWFKDGATYDVQAKTGGIECPYCGDADISKAIMAPAIPSKRSRTSSQQVEAGDAEAGLLSEERAREVAAKILDAVNTLRSHVEGNYDDVGDKFAEEARRIHYGEAEERGIYGQASIDEAEELDEEGIEVFRLPTPPRRDD